METQIFHTVNEGIYLENEGISILIDGIHNGTEVGFSNMPKTLKQDMEAEKGLFKDLDCLLFTHLHPDHFNLEMAEEYLQKNKIYSYGPDFPMSNLAFSTLNEDVEVCFLHHYKIYKIRTTHDGERFKQDNHVIYVIAANEEIFVIGGDAILTEKEANMIQQFVEHPITIVFINPFQMLQEKEQCFIRNLESKHVCLYHLPFDEDDRNNMRRICKIAARVYPQDLPAVEVIDHMNHIVYHN